MKSLSLAALAFLSFSIANIGFADQIAVMHESTDHSEIRIISSQKTDDYAVVTPFQWNIYPELSRDGRLLAFVGGPDQEHLAIQLKNLETGTIDQISETVGFVLHPAFSGDAQKLSYSEIGDNGKNHIVVFNRLTGLYDKIEDVDASLFFPQLNSDGSFIVYQKSLSKTERVLIEKYLGEDDEVELKLPSRNCMAPNISFDDRKIAFTCLVDGLWNVYMMDRASKTVEQITTSASRSFAPAFDRHGQIYYAEEVNGKFEIYVAKRVHEEWTSFPFWSLENSLYSPSLTGDTSYSQSDVSDVPSPARSSFGGLELNGKLYLIGGHQGHEHTYPPESFLDRVDILDLQTGVWSQGASRPVAAHGFEIETCGKNQIYAFGGFAYSEDHNPKWKSLNRVDKYDPVTDTWTQVATMPRARSSNVAAQVGNKIYLIGGWDSTPKSDGDYEGRFHREIDVFNCETEKFENSNLEIPDPLRRAFTGVSIGDKILLIGGLGVGASHFELLDNVTEFDPQSGTFKELAPLPFATFAPAAGVKDGSLFVFGGMYKTGEMNYEYVNHVYKLNGSAWENTGRHLLESKGFAVVVPVADSMLVIGGHSYKDGNDAPVPTIESFN